MEGFGINIATVWETGFPGPQRETLTRQITDIVIAVDTLIAPINLAVRPAHMEFNHDTILTLFSIWGIYVMPVFIGYLMIADRQFIWALRDEARYQYHYSAYRLVDYNLEFASEKKCQVGVCWD